MAKAAAKTGIMPMALVAIEQYFPKAQRVIGLASTPVERIVYAERV